MKYLVDTNVISELVNLKPNKNVIRWFNHIDYEDIYLSVLTIGEIRKGIEKVADAKRKNKLLTWLEQDLVSIFASNILNIDIEVADRWGRLQHQVKRTLPAIDSLIAATALHYDMSLVTHNIKDFKNLPTLTTIDPWQ